MAEEEPEELPPCLWETKNEEGEWGEGKPVVKDGSKQIGPMDWLTEAVANVSANIGGGGGGSSRGQYGRVSTHDDDDR